MGKLWKCLDVDCIDESFPRKRESSNRERRDFSRKGTMYWIPAFAGMTGAGVAPLCAEATSKTSYTSLGAE